MEIERKATVDTTRAPMARGGVRCTFPFRSHVFKRTLAPWGNEGSGSQPERIRASVVAEPLKLGGNLQASHRENGAICKLLSSNARRCASDATRGLARDPISPYGNVHGALGSNLTGGDFDDHLLNKWPMRRCM
eukprot:scaffold1841_cov35-Tisochrysis_lutea.AAC.2